MPNTEAAAQSASSCTREKEDGGPARFGAGRTKMRFSVLDGVKWLQ